MDSGIRRVIATSENRIRYIVQIPRTATAMMKFTTTEAPWLRQRSARISSFVLHWSIDLALRYKWVEMYAPTTTIN